MVSAGHLKLRAEPDLLFLFPGSGNLWSQFFIGLRILHIPFAKPTQGIAYLHNIYKSTINVKTLNRKKLNACRKT